MSKDKHQEPKNETLPAVKEQAELPAVKAQPFDDGLGDVTPEDLIIPRLKVGQDKSPGDVAGKLFIDIEGSALDEMTLVVLKMQKGRVLFSEDYDAGNEPLCKSDNNKTPKTDGGFTPMADKCADCSYSKWTKSESGKPKPPRCPEVWNFLIMDYDTFMPAWFALKVTAMPPAKKLVTMLKLRGEAKRIPAWGFKFKASVGLDKKGSSYIPVFSKLEELDADDLESMTMAHNQLAGEQAGFDEDVPTNENVDFDDF